MDILKVVAVEKVHAPPNPDESGNLNTKFISECIKIHRLGVPFSVLSEKLIRQGSSELGTGLVFAQKSGLFQVLHWYLQRVDTPLGRHSNRAQPICTQDDCSSH